MMPVRIGARCFGTALCCVVLLACNQGGGGGSGAPPGADPGIVAPPPPGRNAPPAPPPQEPPAAPVSRSFEVDWSALLNPEKGYYEAIDLVRGRDFRFLRAWRGFTLGLAVVTLKDFRYGPLPDAFLANLDQGLDAVRAAGVKVILRFRYATYEGDADAPKDWILHHIGQLAPLLRAHADVIAFLQAGFIGAWGEWHHSTHGLNTTADRRDVLFAVLRALPASRMVQIRTPYFKRDIFQRSAPLTPEEAFSGDDYARVGHHNDAFLSDATDLGTYIGDVEGNQAYVAEEGRFVPVGGECNRFTDRTAGSNATFEMSRFHYSFVSGVYRATVIDRWRQEGYYDVIRRQLGYSFSLLEASWTPEAKPGGKLELGFRLRNDGYAPVYNERPVYLILAGNGAWHAARLGSADPRRWEGNREVAVHASFRLPAALPAGTYRLSLWLPDAAASLRDRPEYAVRLANLGTWDPATGQNVLTELFRVDPSAPGPADPSSAALAEETHP